MSGCDHPTLRLDEFVVMPNHLHGIVIIGEDTRAYESVWTTTGAHSRATV